MHLRLVLLVGLFLLVVPASAGAYVETPKWAEEANQQQAEEATRKAQEAKATEEHKAVEERERKVAEEHKAAEEAERAVSQRAEVEAQQKQQEADASMCVVPSLKGDSLAHARNALRQAHCKLGQVTAPHGSHGKLVVSRQSLKRGTKHPGGTTVAVTLGPAKNKGG